MPGFSIPLPFHRLVSEVKRLKGAMRGPAAAAAAAAAPDPAAADQLVAMLRGLGACVSLVHERKHELLLKELLDVPLWQVPQVGRGSFTGAGQSQVVGG